MSRGSARVGAKGLVGVGLVSGVGAALVGLAADPSGDLGADTLAADLVGEGSEAHSQSSTHDASTSQAVRAMLARRGAATGSRSSPRVRQTTPPSVVAPRWQAGTAVADVGRLDVRAVAKPTPRPTSSAPTSSTAAPVAPPADPGGYLAAARALGLGPNAQLVYAAVRTVFPSITTIGGYRAGDPGDHGSGRAVDIMCSSTEGDAIAAYMQAHAAELHITYVIWKQRIWFPGTGTWRPMEDRGSITANHYDHVHVSVE